MTELLDSLAIAAVAFALTNIDDIVLLGLFFASPKLQRGEVVAGQYAGIGALTGLSLAIAVAARSISTGWTHWLGLLPVAIGLLILLGE